MKIPIIQWAQNDTYVFVDIQLEPKDYTIEIKENLLKFKQDDYACDLKLFSNINCNESKYNKNRIFEFYLKKTEADVEWKQLLENKNQYNIYINWNKFDIEDDEVPDGMPDMSSMMGGMSGDMPDMSSMMGGMPDMSSMMPGMPGDFASTNEYCQVCPNQNCDGCEDEILEDFEVSDDEEDDKDDEDGEDEEDDEDEVSDDEEDDEDEDEDEEDNEENKKEIEKEVNIDGWAHPIQPDINDD